MTYSAAALVEARLRRFLELYKPRFIYVFFSAGKDSSAVLAAAASCCREKVVAVYNHIVGQTHVDNARAALETARLLDLPVRRITPGSPGGLEEALRRDPPEPPELLYLVVGSYRGSMDFWSAVDKWGFPAPAELWRRGVRWCCSEFKEKWWRRLPPNGVHDGRPAKYLATGVKRYDSRPRARRWCCSLVNAFRNGPGVDIALAPVADFTDDEVWGLLRHYGLGDVIGRQYRVYGHSPNCTLCPLMRVDALRRTAAALPTPYLERRIEQLERLLERYREGTFSYSMIRRWLRVFREELDRRQGSQA